PSSRSDRAVPVALGLGCPFPLDHVAEKIGGRPQRLPHRRERSAPALLRRGSPRIGRRPAIAPKLRQHPPIARRYSIAVCSSRLSPMSLPVPANKHCLDFGVPVCGATGTAFFLLNVQ